MAKICEEYSIQVSASTYSCLLLLLARSPAAEAGLKVKWTDLLGEARWY